MYVLLLPARGKAECSQAGEGHVFGGLERVRRNNQALRRPAACLA